jgi:Reverse transcriptase (RNA-dependent DNA polymerase)
MAIAAAFNLEIRQYNAVNGFTNAKLSKPVYCYCLERFNQDGHILELLIALYGLKILPLLWYKELTSTLAKFGLKPVLGTNCLFTNRRLIIFFYVNNIAILFAKKDL